MPATLAEIACTILATPAPAGKCALTRAAAADWAGGVITEIGTRPPPARPARPDRPELLPPRRMANRRYGGGAGRVALLHALAHIELNAIDLAWDMVARFTAEDWPRRFHDDWVRVALDEAAHFEALAGLLAAAGAAYGDLPAHDGLWEAALKTAADPLARLAVVPMTLEARGLDTTPTTLIRLRNGGCDQATITALDVIYHDEIHHVAAGLRWFRHLAERRRLEPVTAYHRIIGHHFPKGLKPPFNESARARAGLDGAFYWPMAGAGGAGAPNRLKDIDDATVKAVDELVRGIEVDLDAPLVVGIYELLDRGFDQGLLKKLAIIQIRHEV